MISGDLALVRSLWTRQLQARQPRVHARRIDLLKGHPVNARRARIGAIRAYKVRLINLLKHASPAYAKVDSEELARMSPATFAIAENTIYVDADKSGRNPAVPEGHWSNILSRTKLAVASLCLQASHAHGSEILRARASAWSEFGIATTKVEKSFPMRSSFCRHRDIAIVQVSHILGTTPSVWHNLFPQMLPAMAGLKFGVNDMRCVAGCDPACALACTLSCGSRGTGPHPLGLSRAKPRRNTSVPGSAK
jgi:hypothetical protein